MLLYRFSIITFYRQRQEAGRLDFYVLLFERERECVCEEETGEESQEEASPYHCPRREYLPLFCGARAMAGGTEL